MPAIDGEDEIHKGQDFLSRRIGNFGKWQLKVSILMALIKFPIAWFQMSIVFLAPPTSFSCQNVTEFDQGSKQTGINSGYCYKNQSGSMLPCTQFIYNKTVFSSTITSEWDLVCDRQNLMDLSQVVLMFGILLGNIIFGILADKRGRKQILLVCLGAQAFFGILASVSPYFSLFVLLRFFLALANGGTMVTSFVLCMEIVGGKWRTIVPILYQIPFGLGNALLAVFAYLIRDWRHLHLTISVLSGLYVLMFGWVPESPRWLMTVGKRVETVEIIKSAAKLNGRNFEDFEPIQNKSTESGFRHLFSTRTLRRRCLVLIINWSLTGVTFYAFLQYIGHISDNLFLAVTLGGVSSLPGTLLCISLVIHYGRKPTIIYSLLLTALSCLLILAFPKETYSYDWPRMLLAGFSIIGLSVSLPAMYLFTGELFPTTLRNSGVGLTMMFSRLGSMLAPLIVALQRMGNFWPLVIIAALVLVQIGTILPLPETQGKLLPETIRDLNSHERLSSKNHKPERKTLTTKDIVVY